MDAYSKDLRERVVGACEGREMTQQEVAEAFGVSLSFITKLLRRKRQTGSITAKPRGGGRKPLPAAGHQSRQRGPAHRPPEYTRVKRETGPRDDSSWRNRSVPPASLASMR